jgi:hypothetical protein
MSIEFAVIDMCDDGEIAYVLDRNGRHGGEITLESGTIKRRAA